MQSRVPTYVTLKEAVRILGISYPKIQRAAKRGDFPTYRLFNSRPLVRVDEIEAVIEKSSSLQGGE